jgi:pimeloyl-ACP methyl ester carboxylesterase
MLHRARTRSDREGSRKFSLGPLGEAHKVSAGHRQLVTKNPSTALESTLQVMMSLHGIRTRGTWQKDLVPELSKAGFIPVPLDYGWFGAVKLLLIGSREKQVDWFRDEYSKKCAEHRCERPSIIAHSFGTYLVARAIQKYMLEFDRVIFCGSIVRRDYPWSQLIDHGLVRRVLNDFGRLDLWARVVEWVVSNAGQSGLRGFEDAADGRVVQREHPEFGHSDYFYSKNFRERWVPFLQGEDPTERPAVPRPHPNWRARATAAITIAILAILSILIYARSYRTEDLEYQTIEYIDAKTIWVDAMKSGNWVDAQDRIFKNPWVVWEASIVDSEPPGYIIQPRQNTPEDPRGRAYVTLAEPRDHPAYSKKQTIKVRGRVGRFDRERITIVGATVD